MKTTIENFMGHSTETARHQMKICKTKAHDEMNTSNTIKMAQTHKEKDSCGSRGKMSSSAVRFKKYLYTALLSR